VRTFVRSVHQAATTSCISRIHSKRERLLWAGNGLTHHRTTGVEPSMANQLSSTLFHSITVHTVARSVGSERSRVHLFKAHFNPNTNQLLPPKKKTEQNRRDKIKCKTQLQSKQANVVKFFIQTSSLKTRKSSI